MSDRELMSDRGLMRSHASASMRLLLVTVADPSAASRRNLSTLLNSVARQRAVADLVLGMRGGCRQLEDLPAHVRVHQIELPLVVGLSRARNKALRFASVCGLIGAADVVAFPDDDCRYPDGLLDEIAELVGPGTEIVCCPYGPSADELDRVRFPAEDRRLTPSLVMRVVASGAMFLDAGVVQAVGGFDETLGVGAAYGASEDADYVFRAMSLGAKGEYRGTGLLVEHPYKPSRPDQYYVGNVAALAKQTARDLKTLPSLVHRLAVGLRLIWRRRISFCEYRRALHATGAALLLRVPSSSAR